MTGDRATNSLVARMAASVQDAALQWLCEAAVEASQGESMDTGGCTVRACCGHGVSTEVTPVRSSKRSRVSDVLQGDWEIAVP